MSHNVLIKSFIDARRYEEFDSLFLAIVKIDELNDNIANTNYK